MTALRECKTTESATQQPETGSQDPYAAPQASPEIRLVAWQYQPNNAPSSIISRRLHNVHRRNGNVFNLLLTEEIQLRFALYYRRRRAQNQASAGRAIRLMRPVGRPRSRRI